MLILKQFLTRHCVVATGFAIGLGEAMAMLVLGLYLPDQACGDLGQAWLWSTPWPQATASACP